MYCPVLRSASTNGPEPTAPTSLGKVFTADSLIFDQMCSGRIDSGRWVITGLGPLVVITTVVSSGAVTLVMFAT